MSESRDDLYLRHVLDAKKLQGKLTALLQSWIVEDDAQEHKEISEY